MSKNTAEHLAALADFLNLSPGAIPDWGLVLVDFLNEEGNPKVKYAVIGDPTLEQVVAKVELIKFDVWHRGGEKE